MKKLIIQILIYKSKIATYTKIIKNILNEVNLSYNIQMISAFNRKNWNLDINGERQFWKEKLLNIFINVPEACPHCNIGKIHLKNNESIINPVLGKCTNYKFKRELYFRNWLYF